MNEESKSTKRTRHPTTPPAPAPPSSTQLVADDVEVTDIYQASDGSFYAKVKVTVRPGVTTGTYGPFNKKCPNCFNVTEIVVFTGRSERRHRDI